MLLLRYSCVPSYQVIYANGDKNNRVEGAGILRPNSCLPAGTILHRFSVRALQRSRTNAHRIYFVSREVAVKQTGEYRLLC